MPPSVNSASNSNPTDPASNVGQAHHSEPSAQGSNQPPEIASIRTVYAGRVYSGHQTLCAAPNNRECAHLGPGSLLTQQIQARFADCLTQEGEANRLMMSFHSPKGQRICLEYAKHVIHQTGSNPQNIEQSTKPTVLEHCLRAQTLGEPVQIDIQNVRHQVTVQFTEESLNNHNPGSEAPHLAGRYVLKPLGAPSGQKPIKLPFLEFAPQFDGRSLSPEALLACSNTMAHYHGKPEEALNLIDSQFSSAMGVGRAPALLIVNQFAHLASLQGTQNFSDFDVPKIVDRLIVSARALSHKELIPSPQLRASMVDACKILLRQINSRLGSPGTGREESKEEIESPQFNDEAPGFSRSVGSDEASRQSSTSAGSHEASRQSSTSAGSHEASRQSSRSAGSHEPSRPGVTSVGSDEASQTQSTPSSVTHSTAKAPQNNQVPGWEDLSDDEADSMATNLFQNTHQFEFEMDIADGLSKLRQQPAPAQTPDVSQASSSYKTPNTSSESNNSKTSDASSVSNASRASDTSPVSNTSGASDSPPVSTDSKTSTTTPLNLLQRLIAFLMGKRIKPVLDPSIASQSTQADFKVARQIAINQLKSDLAMASTDDLRAHLSQTCLDSLNEVVSDFVQLDDYHLSGLSREFFSSAQVTTQQKETLANCQQLAQVICLLNMDDSKNEDIAKYQQESLPNKQTNWLQLALETHPTIANKPDLQNFIRNLNGINPASYQARTKS